MAKGKSKEFMLKRGGIGNSMLCKLRHTHGGPGFVCVCHHILGKHFGISLKPGEKKRIRITIEEV